MCNCSCFEILLYDRRHILNKKVDQVRRNRNLWGNIDKSMEDLSRHGISPNCIQYMNLLLFQGRIAHIVHCCPSRLIRRFDICNNLFVRWHWRSNLRDKRYSRFGLFDVEMFRESRANKRVYLVCFDRYLPGNRCRLYCFQIDRMRIRGRDW